MASWAYHWPHGLMLSIGRMRVVPASPDGVAAQAQSGGVPLCTCMCMADGSLLDSPRAAAADDRGAGMLHGGGRLCPLSLSSPLRRSTLRWSRGGAADTELAAWPEPCASHCSPRHCRSPVASCSPEAPSLAVSSLLT
ncbi:hypothetical protein Dimus_036794 [Dionaea muscipula]